MKNSLITRNQIIELSNSAYQLGDYECARRILIAWLKEYPNDLWIRYRLAIVLYKSGKQNEAIRLCEVIVKFDPEFSEVWSLLAVMYPDKSDDRKDAAKRVKLLKSYSKQESRKINKGFPVIFGKKEASNSFDDIENVDDFDVLSAIQIAKNENQQKEPKSYFRIMEIYSRRWPKATTPA